MAYKKGFSVVSVISNLTKSEAMILKADLISKANKVAPKANYFASTGDGSNVERAISNYEARRITKRG